MKKIEPINIEVETWKARESSRDYDTQLEKASIMLTDLTLVGLNKINEIIDALNELAKEKAQV